MNNNIDEADLMKHERYEDLLKLVSILKFRDSGFLTHEQRLTLIDAAIKKEEEFSNKESKITEIMSEFYFHSSHGPNLPYLFTLLVGKHGLIAFHYRDLK